MRRGRWFLSQFWPTPEDIRLERLRMRVRRELPSRQAVVALGLLVERPEFAPPERPVTYDVLALAFGIQLTTVREHLRRIRRNHPDLYEEVMAERRRRLATWHQDVARRRLERSRRWGKARWACRYRAANGEWPWTTLKRSGRLSSDSPSRHR